jgi:type IV pilus assembly protein PilO
MMDLSEINWSFDASGSWPFQVKASIIFLICCLVAGGGYYYFTIDQLAELETLRAEEQTLITEFEAKQRKAVSLTDYRAQYSEIEQLLAGMMKQMPTKAEVANLLAEISQLAARSGLQQKLFQPENEEKKDFYTGLPYTIELEGLYSDLGMFISGLAALPRIVTVHDIDISTVQQDANAKTPDTVLHMKATIKTYNEANNEKDTQKDKGVTK